MVLRPVVPLETEGILRKAANIRMGRAYASLAEQEAAEEPAAAAHRKWGRREERKQVSRQEQLRQYKFVLEEEQRFIGRAEDALRHASNARGALATLEKLFPKGQDIPIEVQQMAEELQGTISRPVAYKKLIGEMLDWSEERKAGLKKIQTKVEAEEERETIGIRGVEARKTERVRGEERRKTERVAGAEREKLEGRKQELRKDFEQYKSTLKDSGFNRGQIDSMFDDAWDAFYDEFYVPQTDDEGEPVLDMYDRPTHGWREDAPKGAEAQDWMEDFVADRMERVEGLAGGRGKRNWRDYYRSQQEQ